MNKQAPRTWGGRRKRGTRHRGSGINKQKREAEKSLAAMRSANTALAASLFLSNAPTQEAGGPMETSTSQIVANTDLASSSPRGRSPPNSSSNHLRTAPINDVAAAATEPQDTEVDTFLASLSTNATSTESTVTAQTPNEDNAGNAAAETQAGR